MSEGDFLEEKQRQDLEWIGEDRQPVLKEPVWIWSVAVYFYLGSTAGTAAALAAAAQCVDSARFRDAIGRARVLSSAFLLTGSVLLIHDLGRRGRFLNMLRVFRASSPMSIGSWLLAATTPLVVLSARFSDSNLRFCKGIGSTAGIVSGLLGLPLAGYTGVLLGTTAVPVWQTVRTLLPPLFLSSGAASASELIQVGKLNRLESKGLERLEILFRSAELVLMFLVSRKLSKKRGTGHPLRKGASGKLWKAAVGLAIGGVCLHFWKESSRGKRMLRAIAGVAGGLSLRFALLQAGKASSRNPPPLKQTDRS